jgi:guanylate kinase
VTDPDTAAGEPGPPPRLTVLSGPSGVGKSTVIERLRSDYPEVWLSVSATTRRPRDGETHGVNYFFVSHDEFAHMVQQGELLEWAEFAGNYYGTPKAPVEEKLTAGIPVLLEIELQGARQIRASMPDAQLVFLAPPSWEELVSRLVGRGTEVAEVISRRLEVAKVEMAAQSEFDVVLINDDVSTVCDRLVTLMGFTH